jgi:lysyl-tRNA synthetase class II
LEEYKQLGDDLFEIEWLDSPEQIARLREFLGIMRIAESEYINQLNLQNLTYSGAKQGIDEKVKEARINERGNIWHTAKVTGYSNVESSAGKALADIFEYVAESKLIQPTFITDYPKSISPLSKASPANPNVAERFELFITGMECANGFSELNDPQEQYERFVDQMRERESGDEEAMVFGRRLYPRARLRNAARRANRHRH